MERKGICKNVGACTMAGKVQVITDDDAEFKCTECDEELEVYKEEPIPVGPDPKKKWIVIAAAVVVLALIGVGAYFLFGKSSKPTAIKLTNNNLTLPVGEKDLIVPTADPEGVKATFTYKVTTGATSVKVSSGGEVTALKAGDAVVLVKCEENKEIRANCKITVVENKDENVTMVNTGNNEGEDKGVEEAPAQEEFPAQEEPKAEGPKKEEAKQGNSKKTSTSTETTQTQNGSGTINLGYGTYVGNLKNGKPDGTGKLTFTRSYQLNSEYTAQPGEYVQGVFENGKPSFVTYYRKDGSVTKIKLR